jgi:hypothetical protein
MKLSMSIACLAAVVTYGCTKARQETASPRPLTEAQATNVSANSNSREVSQLPAFAVAALARQSSLESNAPKSSQRHLTQAQAIALAKPVLPLPAGDSYRLAFKDGIWVIWTGRDDIPARAWTVVTIRDSDGKVLERGNYF